MNERKFSYIELKSQLKELKKKRNDFLKEKTTKIESFFSQNENKNDLSIKENLNDIDSQIEDLSNIILTSINISNSVIAPIKEKENVIQNIKKTIEILEIENELKNLLIKLENDNSIENKIKIILEANKKINFNSQIFDSYREKFLQKNLDVLSYLNTNYNSLKEKINFNNEKENLENLKKMEKNSLLIYKLSNKKNQILIFFDFFGNFISKSILNEKKEIEINEKILFLQKENNKEFSTNLLNEISLLITKTFYKISKFIQERIEFYFKENFKENLLFFFISHILKQNESIIINQFKNLIKIFEIIEKNFEFNDLICEICSNILSQCEKFRFFIQILTKKIEMNFSFEDLNYNKDLNNFFKNFDSLKYDIGEKYCSNEINFMKSKIFSLFEDESKNYQNSLKNYINSSNDDIANLNCIDDCFFVLKTSGNRAISTLNLQMCLAIINHIKDILNEDFYNLLDIKITSILYKTDLNENKYKNLINYSNNEIPFLSNENNFPNLFLIICLNNIDQSKENIDFLLDELKNLIYSNIVNSNIFDANQIQLPIFNNNLNNNLNNNILYIKSNELEMINFAFNDKNILINKYDEFIQKKLKISFEYFYNTMNLTADILNSIDYKIDQNNFSNVEMSESFSSKFINETKIILNQFKTQMNENSYAKFIQFYSEYISNYIEKLLTHKKFNSFGVILLQKDIYKIANFFQGDFLLEIRENFSRLFSFIKILSFETKDELNEHLKKYDDIKLKTNEIEFIRKLKEK